MILPLIFGCCLLIVITSASTGASSECIAAAIHKADPEVRYIENHPLLSSPEICPFCDRPLTRRSCFATIILLLVSPPIGVWTLQVIIEYGKSLLPLEFTHHDHVYIYKSNPLLHPSLNLTLNLTLTLT